MRSGGAILTACTATVPRARRSPTRMLAGYFSDGPNNVTVGGTESVGSEHGTAGRRHDPAA